MLGWDATQYRIDAANKYEDAEREIRVNEQAVQSAASKTFKLKGIADSLLTATKSYARLNHITRQLEDNPREVGTLRRKGLMKPLEDGVRTQAKILAMELRRRSDLADTRREYLAFAHKAEKVEVMKPKDREKELAGLQHRKEYCDANKSTRDLRYQQARKPLEVEMKAIESTRAVERANRQALIPSASKDLKPDRPKSPFFPGL